LESFFIMLDLVFKKVVKALELSLNYNKNEIKNTASNMATKFSRNLKT
jgi:hypothetical protein